MSKDAVSRGAAGALEWVAPIVLLVVSAGLRLPHLDARPLHHDEGSNVIFLLRLVREGSYHYDPTNYHGPLLYFLSALPIALFGTTTTMLRVVPALLGTLMAPLCWMLRRETGRLGALVSGLLIATSPSLVYYSRDNIHEIYLVFLTLLLIVTLARGLRSGRVAWLLLAGATAGALVATKETAGLTFLAIGAGLFLARGLGLPRPRGLAVCAFVLAAAAVAIVLYSDLFSEMSGLLRPIQALRLWGERGLHADGHGKPWWYFLRLLARDEAAVAVGALAGILLLVKRPSPWGLFVAGWAGVVLLLYSSIPYKTPWLVLNIVLPLTLVCGAGFDGGAGRGSAPEPPTPSGRYRWIALLLLGAASMAAARRAYVLSFVRYDDERASALVYVQTRRESLNLVSRIEEYTRGDVRGRAVPIEILSPDYLPLNWYLRDFSDVSYFGALIEHPGAPVVIARSDDALRVERLIGPGYDRETYPLRPGVDLVLFLQRAAPPRPAP